MRPFRVRPGRVEAAGRNWRRDGNSVNFAESCPFPPAGAEGVAERVPAPAGSRIGVSVVARSGTMNEDKADVIVVGGGMVGAAVAYGLARKRIDVLMLDEGDDAFRAARGNFGLVWVQTKGLGLQRYQLWSQESAELYGAFAEELEERTGIDIHHERPGGLMLCLGDDEWEEQYRINDAMAGQGNGYHARMIDRAELDRLVPGVRFGQDVVGASHSEMDGHCGPLRLLRALHAGFAAAGGRHLPGARVRRIERGFRVATDSGVFEAPKLVLAAGNGTPPLAEQVGLRAPITPERGQILVTERVERFLPMPMGSIRQTAEGTIMLGATQERAGFDTGTTLSAGQALAARAVRVIPALSRLRLVRTWAALRIVPPDRCPIYDSSESHPGAHVAVMHSGVTLAAVHAARLPDWIAEGRAPADFGAFSARRFDVSPPE